MQTITREQLKRELDAPSNPVVIEVLPPKYFHEFHLPSAINVPLGPQFDQQIQRAVPDKHQRVVVYCRDQECTASEKAATAMEQAGYTGVVHYQAGKEDWKRAGLPTEHDPR